MIITDRQTRGLVKGNRGEATMKRIIFCFDGTWNRIDAEHPTNVLLMASAISPMTEDGVTQIVHYDNGVGTSLRDKMSGGITGYGLFENIKQAYQFLIFNYDPGDEIYCFGFSRGAFTARSFIGFIRAVGIIERHHAKEITEAEKLYKANNLLDEIKLLDFRTKYSTKITVCREDEERRCLSPDYTPGSSVPFRIRYVGLWDTVETLGLQKVIWPWLPRVGEKPFVGAGHKFHNHLISGMITAGRHAVALDEKRKNFNIEPWGDVQHYNEQINYKADNPSRPFQEVFFPGVHGAVGGGGYYRGLSDAALDWVKEGATEHGLVLDSTETSTAYASAPDFAAPLDNNFGRKTGLLSKFTGKMPERWRKHKPASIHDIHKSAQDRWAFMGELPDGSPYRPETLYDNTAALSALSPIDTVTERKHHSGQIETLRQPANQSSRYYLVKNGEDLNSIALEELGDKKRAADIFALNPDLMENPNKIYAGLVIRIPESG